MADLKENIVPEQYFKKDNTFFTVAKYNPLDLIEKEIGDSKVPELFLPQQKVTRWDNEVNVSVRLVQNETSPVVTKEGDIIKWSGDKIEAKFYDVVSEALPEGASEFEIVLKEKPKTNIVQFTIQDKGVEYSYQTPIPEEEILKLNEQGIFTNRESFGSYAVYASENKVNYVGGKEYKCGKVGHIYRPRIEDSAGNKVFGDLHIENGILSVTIPQDFLDNAVYPVRHAAGLTFGYTTGGVYQGFEIAYNTTTDYIRRNGQEAVLPKNATLDSISGYFVKYSAYETMTASMEVWSKDSAGVGIHDFVTRVEGDFGLNNSTNTWITINASSENLSAGNYILSAIADPSTLNSGTNLQFLADQASSLNFYSYTQYDDPSSYTNAKAVTQWSKSSTGNYRIFNIYATYTATTPIVTTQAVSNIASSTATGNGNVTDDGGATVTERGVCWGTSTNPTIAGSHAAAAAGGTGTFTADIIGLTAETHYYVRAYATNSFGTTYGENVEFTAGEIEKIDTTTADFSAGSHSSTMSNSNNLELAPADYSYDLEGTFPPDAYWSLGGNVNPFKSSTQKHAGSYSLEGGNITHSQQTWAKLTAPNTGTLSFWWKVSSENNYDWLRFLINNVEQFKISGNVDWQQKTAISVTAGDILEWRYTKDNSADSGSDTGWVDDVLISAGGGYQSPGSYESAEFSTAALYAVGGGTISWTETLNGQSLSVETSVSTNGGSSWTSWASVTNGGAIPDITTITTPADGRIKYKVTMSGDGTATPQLHDVTLNATYTAGGGSNDFVIQDESSASSIDNVALALNSGSFAVADEASPSSIDNIVLTQAGGILAVADEASASSIENITLQFQGNFQIADEASASSIDNIILERNGGDFTVVDEESASSIENISLIGNLKIDDVSSESLIDNIAIERSGTLEVGEIYCATEIDNFGLEGNFIIDVMTCEATVDEVELEFNGATFEIADISSTSEIDNIPLVGDFIIQDINAPPTIENIVITSPDISTMNKNVFIVQGGLALQTGGLRIPTCISAERPTALKGSLIYNTELNSLEIYDGANWITV